MRKLIRTILLRIDRRVPGFLDSGTLAYSLFAACGPNGRWWKPRTHEAARVAMHTFVWLAAVSACIAFWGFLITRYAW